MSDYLEFIGLSHKIVGIDLDPVAMGAEDADKNILVEIGDQADVKFLDSIAKKYGAFDVIIDDGSHVCKHQYASFNCLFEHLKSGGIYIVEDVCTSYWPEYNEHGSFSMVEFCKTLVDDVNFFGITTGNTLDRNENAIIEHIMSNRLNINTSISSMQFFNSTILIYKR